MNQPNPLDNLRDIHLPEAISAWPPAPGWWILAIIILCLLFWVGWKLRQRYQKKHLMRVSLSILTELEQDYASHQDPRKLVKQYSSLIRRIAVARFSRSEAASLTGNSWLEFLNSSGQQEYFNGDIGQLLLSAPYRQVTIDSAQLDALGQAIRSWVNSIYSNVQKVEQDNIRGQS